jgi:hypothetical protein
VRRGAILRPLKNVPSPLTIPHLDPYPLEPYMLVTERPSLPSSRSIQLDIKIISFGSIESTGASEDILKSLLVQSILRMTA